MKTQKTNAWSFATAKLHVIIAIAMITVIGFAFATCGDKDGDDDGDDTSPTDGGGSTSLVFTDQQVYEFVVGGAGTTLEAVTGSSHAGSYPNYSSSFGNQGTFADAFTSPVCTIANGKLTVNLGVPKAAVLETMEELEWDDVVDGSDTTAKIFTLSNFYDNSHSMSLNKDRETEVSDYVLFVYVDKPVTLIGSLDYYTFNSVSLTTGWNMLLFDYTPAGSTGPQNYAVTKITALDSTYKWVIYEMGD